MKVSLNIELGEDVKRMIKQKARLVALYRKTLEFCEEYTKEIMSKEYREICSKLVNGVLYMINMTDRALREELYKKVMTELEKEIGELRGGSK